MGRKLREGKMSETTREYAPNYRQAPIRTRFKKGWSGNPRGSAREKPGGTADRGA